MDVTEAELSCDIAAATSYAEEERSRKLRTGVTLTARRLDSYRPHENMNRLANAVIGERV